jgi:hypothetical protein
MTRSDDFHSDPPKVHMIYRIDGGILNGTEIEPIMAFIAVKYPHRKSKDLYVPPMKSGNKEIKTWHCCQDNCSKPDFDGGIDSLIEHILLHKGRLLKPWNKQSQLKAPIPAIKLPSNPWNDTPKCSTNDDRKFCLDLYISSVKYSLRKQGLEIIT